MADAEDVRRLALSLPQVEEIDSDGFDFRVGGKGFVWSYPERLPGKPREIRVDVAVLCVGDEAEKQALVLGEPGIFFTTPGYDRVDPGERDALSRPVRGFPGARPQSRDVGTAAVERLGRTGLCAAPSRAARGGTR